MYQPAQPMTEEEIARKAKRSQRIEGCVVIGLVILFGLWVWTMSVAQNRAERAAAARTAAAAEADRKERLQQEIRASLARVRIIEQTYHDGIWITLLRDTVTNRVYLRTSGPTPLVELVPQPPSGAEQYSINIGEAPPYQPGEDR